MGVAATFPSPTLLIDFHYFTEDFHRLHIKLLWANYFTSKGQFHIRLPHNFPKFILPPKIQVCNHDISMYFYDVQ